MKADTEMLDKKIELIQWLSTLDDEATIEKLMQFRNRESKDWWDKMSDEEKVSLEDGLKDADHKKLTEHTTVRKLYEKWL